jgi:hypothetical protein
MYIRVARLHTSKNYLGKFGKAFDWAILVIFMVIWEDLQQFGLFCGHLVHFTQMFWHVAP